jgi:hypothetical protein
MAKKPDPTKSIGDCPICKSPVVPAGDAYVYAGDPESDDILRPAMPTHLTCGYRHVREHACPRCGESNWQIDAQAYASLTFGGVVAQSASADGDSFMGLSCEACKLSLIGEPGDGRIRRATLREGADPLNIDEGGDLPEIDNDEWTADLAGLADYAIQLFR